MTGLGFCAIGPFNSPRNPCHIERAELHLNLECNPANKGLHVLEDTHKSL